jgi:hypothetical protein
VNIHLMRAFAALDLGFELLLCASFAGASN